MSEVAALAQQAAAWKVVAQADLFAGKALTWLKKICSGPVLLDSA